MAFDLGNPLVLALWVLVMVAPIGIARYRGLRFWWLTYVGIALTLTAVSPLGWFAWGAALVFSLWPRRRASAAVLTLALLGSLLVVAAPQAQAIQCYDKGPQRQEVYTAGPPRVLAGWVSLKVHFCVKRPSGCASLYPCFDNVLWQREYHNGSYHLDHWYSNYDDSGSYDNGLKWRFHKVGAQFENCTAPYVCQHFDAWMAGTIYTDGTATFKGSTT